MTYASSGGNRAQGREISPVTQPPSMPVELTTHRDRMTGLEVTQWTNYKGHSHHFYFTNPGWYDGGRKLLFGSDRANRTNLFGLDLATGEIEQITDLEPVALPRELEFLRACKNPAREEAYFMHGLDVTAVDLSTKKLRVLHELDPKWVVSQVNCSADGEFVYFGTWEDQSHKFEVDLLRGYVGFAETWAAMPLSQIVRVPVDGGPAAVVFEEKYWIGHTNTSPARAELLTFCHEGPWDKVDNRIWGLHASTGKVWKIRETSGAETVGHEYWFADGVRVGYHGKDGEGRPMLGFINHDGTGRVEASFPGQTGHIFSFDESLIVGDGGGVIRLWKPGASGYLPPRVLCTHGSCGLVQQTHPHPRISPDGKSVFFSTDRGGYGNICSVPISDFDSLPPA